MEIPPLNRLCDDLAPALIPATETERHEWILATRELSVQLSRMSRF